MGPVTAFAFLDSMHYLQGNIPFLELTVLGVLAVITIYRKKLSSNDEYRDRVVDAPNGESHDLGYPDFNLSAQVASNFTAGKVDGSSGSNRRRLDDIPVDVMLQMVCFLDTAELTSWAVSNKHWHKFVYSDPVWFSLWLLRYDSMWNDTAIRMIISERKISWNPYQHGTHPSQGWFLFYLQFEYCWMDWLLAGFCTTKKCLLGLDGAIYDITAFIDEHPGSPETLTEHSGGDATGVFDEIGHSSFARTLADSFLLWAPDKSSDNAPQLRLQSFSSGGSISDIIASYWRSSSFFPLSASLSPPAVTGSAAFGSSSCGNRRTRFQRSMEIARSVAGAKVERGARQNLSLGGHDGRRVLASATDVVYLNLEKGIFFSSINEKHQIVWGKVAESILDVPKRDRQRLVHIHFGQKRVIFDPVLQQWMCWYTCCGLCMNCDDAL